MTDTNEMTVEQWLAIRKEEAPKIDPATAEVTWWYAQTMDPYGVDPDLPDELKCIGRATLPAGPATTFGFPLAICPRKRATHC